MQCIAICLLVLHRVTLSSPRHIYLPTLWKGTDEFNDAEVEVDDIIKQVLTNNGGKSESKIQPFPLEEIYFHNDEQDFSMRLYKMEGYSKMDFKTQKLHTVLPEHHIDVSMLLPKMHVEGFYEADRMSYGDYESKAAGYFWLSLGNLTADGIAILKSDNDVLQVDKMRLTYKAIQKRIQISQHNKNDRLSAFIESEEFGRTILQKIWRDLSYNLNKRIEDKINPALKKKPLKMIMGDVKKFARYEEENINSTDGANKMVDMMIEYARNMITEKYNGRIKIPDMKEGFEKTVLFVTWRGEFVANQGTARGLATVERMGDTVFANDKEDMLHFYGTLGFEHVDLFYDHYKASFMGIGPSGSFSTKFFPIDIYVHIHVDFKGRRVYLDEFKVMKIGDMEVKLMGWGSVLDWVTTKLATWIGGLFRDKIVYDLRNKYDGYITDFLDSYDLDAIMEGKFKK